MLGFSAIAQSPIALSIKDHGITAQCNWFEQNDGIICVELAMITSLVSLTETSDVIVGIGTLTQLYNCNTTEQNDGIIISSSVANLLLIAMLDNNDTFTISSTLSVNSNVNLIDQSDSTSISTNASNSNAILWVETSDTLTIVLNINETATFQLNETDDIYGVSVKLANTVTAVLLEHNDGLLCNVGVVVLGTTALHISWLDQNDSLSSISTILVNNFVNLFEGNDILSSGCQLISNTDVNWVEASDTNLATASATLKAAPFISDISDILAASGLVSNYASISLFDQSDLLNVLSSTSIVFSSDWIEDSDFMIRNSVDSTINWIEIDDNMPLHMIINHRRTPIISIST